MRPADDETLCFFNGEYIRLKDANLNIRTHALQYGTGCFGGIRGYYNKDRDNIFVFRIRDHFERLHQSARILQMKLPYSVDELTEQALHILRESKWRENVYLRPIVYKDALELSPRLHNVSDGYALYAIPLNDYLDTNSGLTTMVSSWVRISDNQVPTRSKATGGYINSALAKSEALANGYDEAIFLDINGYVSEGSAENIFIVRNGNLITPPKTASILEGITRRSLIELAEKNGITVEERNISRTELYMAGEVFFAGTGVQLAWIREIDRRVIGEGRIGPVSQKLRGLFFDIVRGNNDEYASWLTPVY